MRVKNIVFAVSLCLPLSCLAMKGPDEEKEITKSAPKVAAPFQVNEGLMEYTSGQTRFVELVYSGSEIYEGIFGMSREVGKRGGTMALRSTPTESLVVISGPEDEQYLIEYFSSPLSSNWTQENKIFEYTTK